MVFMFMLYFTYIQIHPVFAFISEMRPENSDPNLPILG